MTLSQMRAVLRQIKPAIKYANDHQDLNRVSWLKTKKSEIKARIKKIEDANMANHRHPFRPRAN